MAYPERYHLDAVRKLEGDAYVSFPTADLTAKTVERVYRVPREKVATPDVFNAPQTFEYTDTQLVDQHFTGGDAQYVEVYQKWETLPGTALKTITVGVPDSLIPEKYRRLVRTVETNQTVGPNYVFPPGLTGSQNFISLTMESLSKWRLKVLEQVINSDADPLISGKTGEFGNLIINEEVVDEGTPPLTGNLIQSSEVNALGNGQSIRITVKYPDDLFNLQKVSRSIGQDNLIPEKYRRLIRHVVTEKPVPVDYTFPTGLVGDQTFIEFAQNTITEARLKITEEVIDTDETPLTGGETGEFGNLIILESIVDEGTPPDFGQLIQKSTVSALGNGKAVRITVKYPDDLFSLQKVTKSIGVPDSVIPQKYRRLIRHVETEKPVAVDYAFPTALAGDQTFVEFAQKTITEARLRIIEEVLDTDEAPLASGALGQWGPESITEEVVDEGTAPKTGFLVRESKVDALGNGKAIRITVYYPSDLATRTLIETVVDESSKVVINVEKKIVAAGTTGGLIMGNWVEIQAVDFQHSIQITSVVGELPEDESYGTIEEMPPMPDVLEGIDIRTDGSSTSGSGANSGQEDSCDGEPIIHIRHGHRGQTKGTIMRHFSTSPPAAIDLAEPLIIRPVTGTIVIQAATQGQWHSEGSWDTSGSYRVTSSRRFKATHVPAVLTDSIFDSDVFGSGLVSGVGTWEINFYASDPIGFSGDFVYRVRVSRLRFGIWLTETTVLTMFS